MTKKVNLFDTKKLWRHTDKFLSQKMVLEIERYIQSELESKFNISIIKDGFRKMSV